MRRLLLVLREDQCVHEINRQVVSLYLNRMGAVSVARNAEDCPVVQNHRE